MKSRITKNENQRDQSKSRGPPMILEQSKSMCEKYKIPFEMYPRNQSSEILPIIRQSLADKLKLSVPLHDLLSEGDKEEFKDLNNFIETKLSRRVVHPIKESLERKLSLLKPKEQAKIGAFSMYLDGVSPTNFKMKEMKTSELDTHLNKLAA